MIRWLLLGAVLLVACGKDGDQDAAKAGRTGQTGGAGAAAQGTPASAAQVAADVVLALLTQEDMPPEWHSTTRTTAKEGDETTRLCDKSQTYRLLGRAKVQFSHSQQPAVIEHTVTTFAPGDAKRVLDDNLAMLDRCKEWRETGRDGVARTYRVSRLSFPEMGEQSLAMRMDIESSTGRTQLLIVLVRRGDMTTALTQTAATTGRQSPSTDQALMEGLARRATARLTNLTAGR